MLESRANTPGAKTIHIVNSDDATTRCGLDIFQHLVRGQGTRDPKASTCIECKRVADTAQAPPPKLYKRYMVFDMSQHTASGGIDDCVDSFDSLLESQRHIEKLIDESGFNGAYDIFDRVGGRVIQ